MNYCKLFDLFIKRCIYSHLRQYDNPFDNEYKQLLLFDIILRAKKLSSIAMYFLNTLQTNLRCSAVPRKGIYLLSVNF